MEMPCIQEELTSLAVRGKAPKPAKANTFLFINNTSSINPREVRGKQGGNPDVRSHVGRRSRREKKEQERLQRETDERSGYVALAPRTSSNSEEDILLEQIPTPVRYPKSSKLCSLSLKSHTPDYESSIDTSIYDIPELRSLQNSDERRRRTSSIEAFGGGRLDPFHSSVNASANLLTHELVDIACFKLVPLFISDQSVPQGWFSLGLGSSTCFNILAYAGYIHRNLLRNGTLDTEATIPLYHKGMAIRGLVEAMNNPPSAMRDEIAMTIGILAIHEALDLSETYSPFDSPLKNAQWLSAYGRVERSSPHIKVLQRIVQLRGGLEALTPDMAWTNILHDTIMATKAISAPVYKSLRIFAEKKDLLRPFTNVESDTYARAVGTRFSQLQNYGLTIDMLKILDDIALLTQVIESHLLSTASRKRLSIICDARCAIQHELISLPPGSAIPEISTYSTYESIRLTSLIYGIAVILPIPNNHQPLQTLSQLLKASLEVSGICPYMPDFMDLLPARLLEPSLEISGMSPYIPDLLDLLLWMLVMGGIASENGKLKKWYVLQLCSCVKIYGVRDWERIEEGMYGFLWFHSACAAGGKRLWGEVMREDLESIIREGPGAIIRT